MGLLIDPGATTIWERWDGWTEEHGFQAAGMNSFNHYALGSVGEWLYEYVAGMPGRRARATRAVLIAPEPGGGWEWARAVYRSVRGPISSAWRRDGRPAARSTAGAAAERDHRPSVRIASDGPGRGSAAGPAPRPGRVARAEPWRPGCPGSGVRGRVGLARVCGARASAGAFLAPDAPGTVVQ